MPEEVLKAVVYCHRVADGKDITAQIVCIPPAQAKVLESELLARKEEGELDIVQIGRIYIQKTVFTEYSDQVEEFLASIDEVQLPKPTGEGFTGFDYIEIE